MIDALYSCVNQNQRVHEVIRISRIEHDQLPRPAELERLRQQ